MQLLVHDSAPDAWLEITSLLMDIRGYHADTPAQKIRRLEAAFANYLQEYRRALRAIEPNAALGEARFQALVHGYFQDMLGREQYRSLHPQYLQERWFDEVCGRTVRRLWSSFANCGDWRAVVDQFLGVGSIPVMTVHKSKGLEYDTVLFIGLEDAAFWKYTDEKAADDCTFFVAVSRAKRRMYFTFSERRGTGYQGAQKEQRWDNIKFLRDMLEKADVPNVDYRARPREL